MTQSTSRLSFQDCYDLMDQALANSRGIRIKLNGEDAWYLRLRFHQARKIDRKDNADIYEEGEPMHGRSVYDALTVRIRFEDEETYLYIEKLDASRFLVEPLEGEG